MNLRQRSKFIYLAFVFTAFVVITFGISVIEKNRIEKNMTNLIPEFRRSLIQGDNRAVREIIRDTARFPIVNIEVKRFDGIVVDSQSSGQDFTFLNFTYSSSLKLTPAEREIGAVWVDYTLDQSLRDGALVWFIFLAISSPMFVHFRSNLIKIEALNLENARSTAIARTTQMLAHDVRKPFNLFRMTMDRVRSAQTPEQMKAILNEALPEVDRSLASVNGLIADVLNVGAEGQLELKPLRLAPMVDDVIDEVRRLHPSQKLDVKVSVPSELWVQADFTRIPRVFLNILSNAVEAVGAGGHQDAKLWVSARELDGNFIEVRVGNAGSYIAPENLDKLFDLFFTSGKTGGTGLGLAIVKKIVTQHGGSVHCTSEKNAECPTGRVEFVLTLQTAIAVAGVPIMPVLKSEAAPDVLPQPTKEYRSATDTHAPQPDLQKPQVVFLDDSPLARWAWENKLKARVSVRCFDGPKAFFEKLEKGSADTLDLRALHTIITDHYFTPDEQLTGLELARELRKRGFNGRILLASNGEFSSSELAGIVDKIVDKQPVEWDRLGV
ncbi:MAG: sensor histidine kinase [Proteobacteria bacterium]|nr:sensor histidine kinase [Pseudomonadota bacterium]